MHQRLSVSGLCYFDLPFPALIEELERLGVGTTTLMAGQLKDFGLDRAQELLASSGITVAGLIGHLPQNLGDPQTWDDTRADLIWDLDAAAQLGAPALYTVTGSLLDGDEDASFDTFARFIEPVAAHAGEVGVHFAIEPTLPAYAYVSFTHTLESTLRLARQCNMGICLDVYHVWNDPDLSRTLREFIDHVALVQIGDSGVDENGTTQKQIPGEGDVPMTDLIGQIIDAGYQGAFDLEIDGPLIEAVGTATAIERSVAYLDRTLSAASATSR
ncbi:sugar phosphate isomerase/epimerase family protein [Rhodococcus sp. NPDC003318]|uniref:sugar phosphate isomerase/epimerase family protein n=1 Tax=Rhodococcus sp. NPDC003318 TaxID=3364503 RepID=UPI00368FD1D7